MNEDRVLISVAIAAPLSVVWPALREPQRIRTWFGWDYDGIDEEIETIFVAGAEVDEGAWTLEWYYGPEWGGPARDRFEVRSDGDRTVVRVTRSAPADGATWQDTYDDMAEGWITFVHQLRFALERHPDEERRTLLLTGTKPAEGEGPLPLGLNPMVLPPVGEPYELDLADGTTLSGVVWASSTWQSALTVEDLGDALLVVIQQPDRGEGTEQDQLLLSVYGPAVDHLEDVRERWTAWFDEYYDSVVVEPS